MRRWGCLIVWVLVACAKSSRDESRMEPDSGSHAHDAMTRDAERGLDAAMSSTDAMTVDGGHMPMRDAGMPQPGIYAWGPCPNRLLTTATDAGLDQVIEALDAGTLMPDLECQSGTECTAQPFGRCLAGVEGDRIFTRCVYMDCFEHADCPMGQGCGCWSSQEMHCVPATCRADRDCPSGEQCLPWEYCYLGSADGFSCTTPEDECHTSQDCFDIGHAGTCASSSAGRYCEVVICD